MRCYSYKKLIVLYLYRELAKDKQRRLEQHLDRCAACRKELEAFRAVIDRAALEEPPVPSNRTIEGIRRAARISIEGAGRGVPRVLWGRSWYGARAGVLAAVASVLLIAAVATLVARVGRGPTGPESEPPAILAEPPELSPNPDEGQMGAGDLPRQPDSLMQPVIVPVGLETRLANLEADTFYMGRELALETAPALDRRFQSLADGVVTLGLEWE
jgi:hypothetical protein